MKTNPHIHEIIDLQNKMLKDLSENNLEKMEEDLSSWYKKIEAFFKTCPPENELLEHIQLFKKFDGEFSALLKHQMTDVKNMMGNVHKIKTYFNV